METRLQLPSRPLGRVLTLNRLRSSQKDDQSIVTVICMNTEDRILVPSSDLLQDKDTFILIVQDSGTLGLKLVICLQNIQVCGTGFLLLCESCYSTEKFLFSSLF